jgi:hypothetical protein
LGPLVKNCPASPESHVARHRSVTAPMVVDRPLPGDVRGGEGSLRPLVRNSPAFSESPFARHRSQNCADGCRPPTPRSTACPSPFPDCGSPCVALTYAPKAFPSLDSQDERINTPSNPRGTARVWTGKDACFVVGHRGWTTRMITRAHEAHVHM